VKFAEYDESLFVEEVVSRFNGTERNLREEVVKSGRDRSFFSPLGLRGGNWNNNATNLQVSDRNNAGWTNTERNNNIGFRPAKTSYRSDFF
jgi:hypothetical protein